MKIKTQEYLEKLQNSVQELLESGGFQELFKSTALLRSYSFANTLLIYIQRRNATHVAGFHRWKELGRYVKKGEKGIAIFAPMFMREKNSHKDEAEVLVDPAIEATTTAKYLSGFRVVYVYDISQTDGKAIEDSQQRPSFRTAEGVDVQELYGKILSICPVRVIYEKLPRCRRGEYRIDRDEIAISPSLTDMERPKTLIHEIAHKFAAESGEHTWSLEDRSQAEVIAEGAAFIVCSHFGIDTSEYSFKYVASWGQDIKNIMSWGTGITRVANKIIDLIESQSDTLSQAA